MNNQFFGDVRDFYKYALLRILSNSGKCSISVCWLLTTECRNGGGKLGYLCKNDENDYKQKDKDLFNFLHDYICKKQIRNVNVMGEIIHGAEFFADEFPLDEGCREKYRKKFIKKHGENKLLFFDPDTGIRPNSIRNHEENEYIRKCEIKNLWDECKTSSLMIFQYLHIPLKPNINHIRHAYIMRELKDIDEQANIFCLYIDKIAYYFMIRNEHNEICDRIHFAKKSVGV